jgi:hypothetical protein
MAQGQWTEIEARGVLETWRRSGLTAVCPSASSRRSGELREGRVQGIDGIVEIDLVRLRRSRENDPYCPNLDGFGSHGTTDLSVI